MLTHALILPLEIGKVLLVLAMIAQLLADKLTLLLALTCSSLDALGTVQLALVLLLMVDSPHAVLELLNSLVLPIKVDPPLFSSLPLHSAHGTLVILPAMEPMVNLPITLFAELELNLLALPTMSPPLIPEVDAFGIPIKQVTKTNAKVRRSIILLTFAPLVELLLHPLTTTRLSVIAKASAPRIPPLIPTMSP